MALAPANAKVFHETPGYHGALSIDPTTGAILRITLAAELKDDDPITRAAIVVQYGPVMIGDRNYICPIRSLAFSMEQAGTSGGGNSANASSKAVDDAWGSPVSHPDNSPVLLVNETRFSHYHRLGTSIRIVADAPESASANAGPPTMIAAGPVPGGSTFSPPATQPSGTDGSAGTPAPAVAAQPESAPAPPPPAPAQPFIPEISLTAANGVSDERRTKPRRKAAIINSSSPHASWMWALWPMTRRVIR